MNTRLLIFGSKNFNDSINDIREYLNYFIILFDLSKKTFLTDPLISAIIVEGDVLTKENLSIINKINNKPILLIESIDNKKKCKYDEKLIIPISVSDLKSKIIKINSSFKFLINSSLQIKDYILNKNEKKIIKDGISISITEKEIELIELLFVENKPLTKKNILKIIWNYSENADTHTVETHIYRLRKKIYDTFKDDKFILNYNECYSI